MRCLFPHIISNPVLKKVPAGFAPAGQSTHIIVPCGKCSECLKERRRVWLFRLVQESYYSVSTFFTTLSFDDNKCAPRLLKSDLQLLFKRLRKSGYVFSYYAIGEFGSKFGRPHYHVLFFLKDDCDLVSFHSELQSQWKYGFVDATRANIKRLNYITHYHIRPKTNDKYSDQKGFQLFSKGLGCQYMTDEVIENIRKSASNIVEDFEGRTCSLPRYYRKKFDIPSKDEMQYKSHQWNFLTEYARKRGMSEFDIVREMHRVDDYKLQMYNEKESF